MLKEKDARYTRATIIAEGIKSAPKIQEDYRKITKIFEEKIKYHTDSRQRTKNCRQMPPHQNKHRRNF